MQKIPCQGLAHRFFPVPIKHPPLLIFLIFVCPLPFLLGDPLFIKYLPPPPQKKKKHPPMKFNCSFFPEYCCTEIVIVSSLFFVTNEFKRL